MKPLTQQVGAVPPAVPTRRAGAVRSEPAPLRFDSAELAGSLGDLGTFLPLAVGLTVACGMDLELILIFAGLMNAASGLLFRQPIAVQPMKAIAAVAIAEGLTTGEIAAAGILMGIAVTTLALIGAVGWIDRVIPRPIVRGIQAGVGLKLAWTGFEWLGGLPLLGLNSVLIAIAAGLVLIALMRLRQPAMLYLFPAGFALLYLADPAVYSGLTLTQPAFHLAWPAPADWWTGLTQGALPQLPLTLLNSVVAVCALSADCFPGRGIAPRRMAASVGLMNLVSVPLGGMPMCHGAGGLAAQYRFGARTGGSVIMLGGMKIAAGLLLGAGLIGLLQAYPRSILGIMVIAAGLTLASAARDALRGRALILMLATALPILLINTLGGFLVGCALAAILTAVDLYTRNTAREEPAHGERVG